MQNLIPRSIHMDYSKMLWRFACLFSQLRCKSSSQSWCLNRAFLLPNCSLRLCIVPSRELRFWSETSGGISAHAFLTPNAACNSHFTGGSQFFVTVWSENDFDHFLIERPRRNKLISQSTKKQGRNLLSGKLRNQRACSQATTHVMCCIEPERTIWEWNWMELKCLLCNKFLWSVSKA